MEEKKKNLKVVLPDMADKMAMLEPEESPLYTMIRKIKQQQCWPDRADHTWLEDDLIPAPREIAKGKEPTKRVCPYFIICDAERCDYYVPKYTDTRVVICHHKLKGVHGGTEHGSIRGIKRAFEEFVKGDDNAVFLVDVDVDEQEVS